MEERGLGVTVGSPLLVASAVEPYLGRPAARAQWTGVDGAATVADVVWIVGRDRDAILRERGAARRADTSARVAAATAAAEAAARRQRAAGDLEDLGGEVGAAGGAEVPDLGEINALIAQLARDMDRGKRTVVEARRAADSWKKSSEQARLRGEEHAARAADKNADDERRRMHEALAELARLEKESARLKKAREVARAAPEPRRTPPPASDPRRGGTSTRAPRTGGAQGRSVDELLERLKREQGKGPRRSASGPSTVDDELEALKRRMADPKRRKS
jgi:hypothetical protein